METSFRLDGYHFNVPGVSLHGCELRIHGNFNFPFGGNSGGSSEYKTRISPMLMIMANKMIVK